MKIINDIIAIRLLFFIMAFFVGLWTIRIPTIKDNLYNDLKKKGPFFVRLWAKMTRSVKNFFHKIQRLQK